MTSDDQQRPAWRAAVEFLREYGADRLPHPGGTLLEHVVQCRVLWGWAGVAAC